MSVRGDILAALETEFNWLTENSGTYPLDINSVHHYEEPLQTLDQSKFPAIFVIDPGTEELLAEDGSNYFYRMPLIIGGAIKQRSGIGLPDLANKMLATLKQFIDSEPNLGTGFRDMQYVGQSEIAYGPDAGIAVVRVDVYVLYACAAGTF